MIKFRKKVLIVDDDPVMVHYAQKMLRMDGYDVVTAKNETEFRKAVESEHPSLIILDIMLGDKNGPLLYNEMLGKEIKRSTPIIFLSALASDQTPVAAGPGRSYALRGKPFDSDELVREINQMLEG